MQQPQHVYEGPAYRCTSSTSTLPAPSSPHALTGRGLSIANNAELRLKYNDHHAGFPVGSLLTFAAFTSVSLHDHVAQDFGDHVLFNFTRVRGVRIRALSAVPQEAEVLVPPPSVFRILTVAMFHGSLVVTLERVDSPLTYLALASSPAAPPLITAAAATLPTPATSFLSSALSSLSIEDVAIIVPCLPPLSDSSYCTVILFSHLLSPLPPTSSKPLYPISLSIGRPPSGTISTASSLRLQPMTISVSSSGHPPSPSPPPHPCLSSLSLTSTSPCVYLATSFAGKCTFQFQTECRSRRQFKLGGATPQR